MSNNIGGIDRTLRIVVGAALIVPTLIGMLPAWGWIGAIPLITGLLSWCPAYTLLGLNTCPCNNEE
ncbi:MAG: DUF2892 domain-containing protein [Gammaproteobacteria bacterium]|jgi:hypothetical protein|nr:DUF2892 domain-containing protein [Gammaproteobacteria bacterium]MBT4605549.1 DUF2892 domain-containing protein [Thiotrichales bacterium]MBT3473123.1 DUF2892 domain-containing protein [Gammaproteobacteria bacterium]MBT3967338.1 DUF2892 domain-containing protein [Gammaproteobacteria bacterium]MBT4080018.1 DUF2892 domain-containing protein [Gammaproteobacteria bacterium]